MYKIKFNLKYTLKKRKRKKYDIEWVKFVNEYIDNGYIELLTIYPYSGIDILINTNHIYLRYSFDDINFIEKNIFFDIEQKLIYFKYNIPMTIKFNNNGWKKVIELMEECRIYIRTKEVNEINNILHDIRKSETINFNQIIKVSYLIIKNIFVNIYSDIKNLYTHNIKNT